MSAREIMRLTLYDVEAGRLMQCEKNLQQALREMGLQAAVTCISEPPFLAREQLLDRVPVVEYQDKRWSLTPGKIPGVEQLKTLLAIMQGRIT